MAKQRELWFVRDLVSLLRREASEARKKAVGGDDFQRGRSFAYFEVLDLLLSQAKAFEIELATIGSQGFDPYELLSESKSTREDERGAES